MRLKGYTQVNNNFNFINYGSKENKKVERSDSSNDRQ